MKVDILGTEYTISFKTPKEDSFLESTKQIVVAEKSDDNELGDYEWYKKKVLRHEIIHAFLFESGLHENWEHKENGHDETVVDWIAVQFPKLLAVFKAADAM